MGVLKLESGGEILSMFGIVHFNVPVFILCFVWLGFWLSLTRLEYTMEYKVTYEKKCFVSLFFCQVLSIQKDRVQYGHFSSIILYEVYI